MSNRMIRWTLSDLTCEFGRLDDGDTIELHGTVYKLHNVNTWNDSCLLEDTLGTSWYPEPEELPKKSHRRG